LSTAPNLFITAALMLKELFTALLCSFAIAGQMRAQEVEVAREAKPNPTERVAPVSERTDSESETVTKTKSHGREKKSASSVITVEQMRMAGALAAERTSSVEGSSLQGPKAATLAERQKTETRVEQANAHRAPTAHSTNSEALSPGSVRPTMLESGKQEPRPVTHYSYKTPEGKKESAPVITQYYPKRIVYPLAKVDRHIDRKLMQAATIAQERAHAHSRSMCWHYVKEALLASGVIDSRPKSEFAKDAAQDLVNNYGFKKLAVKDPFAAPVGSVLVYGANRAAGHVEIRTNDGFVSDFCSKTPSPRPLLGVYAKL
jgi:hypothetical protein